MTGLLMLFIRKTGRIVNKVIVGIPLGTRISVGRTKRLRCERTNKIELEWTRSTSVQSGIFFTNLRHPE